jgi:hypothetical protein
MNCIGGIRMGGIVRIGMIKGIGTMGEFWMICVQNSNVLILVLKLNDMFVILWQLITFRTGNF